MANAKKLTNIIVKVLKNRGLSPTHAMISAKALINAELVGAHSHGLSRLKMYCDRIDKKVINPCLLYTSPSPRDATLSRMPSSA